MLEKHERRVPESKVRTNYSPRLLVESTLPSEIKEIHRQFNDLQNDFISEIDSPPVLDR